MWVTKSSLQEKRENKEKDHCHFLGEEFGVMGVADYVYRRWCLYRGEIGQNQNKRMWKM